MNGGDEEDVSDEKFRIVHGYGNSEGNNSGDGVPEPETRNIVRILMDRSSGRFGCYGASGVPKKKSNGGNSGLLNVGKCSTRDVSLSSSPNSTIDSTFHRCTGKIDGDTEGVGSTRESVYNDNGCATFSMSDLTSEIRRFGEAYSVTRFNADYLDMRNNTVSTISVAFSPDGKTLASTHGDHTVKITCCHSGRLIHSMEGHPRTPWTVKFHPTDSSRCASGCIGYQVRFWDTENGVCLKMVRLFNAIISLSFHPRGRLLSIACGNAMYLWDYMNRDSPHAEWAHEHTLRCVCFLPSGNKIIVGGLIRRQNSGGNPNDNRDTFGLKLWDFDFDAACSMIEGPGSLNVAEGEAIAQRVMTNSRRFLNHALLYNDGGFDVSPCGKHLIACSELLIPHGDACIISMVRAMERERRIERERERDQSNFQLDGSPLQDEEHQHSRQMSRFDALSLNSPLQVRANNHQQTQRRVHTRDESMNATNDNVVQNGDETGSEVRESDTNEGYTPGSPPAHAVDRSLPNSPPPPPGRRRNDTEEFVLPEISRSRTSVSLSSRLGSSGRALSPPPPPQRRRTQYSSDVLNKHNPTRRLPNTQDANAEVQAYTTEADEYDRPTLTPDRRRILRELALHLASGKPVPMDTAQNMTLFTKECRRIPHVVLISLDDEMDKLGQLLDACPLEESRASGVTCVKFSPSTQYCLLGYGVRENEDSASDRPPHQVTSLFRVRGGMKHMVSLLSLHDDVNIARFHPESGHGFVYGTKQGRVRILSPKPWTSQISPKD